MKIFLIILSFILSFILLFIYCCLRISSINNNYEKNIGNIYDK